MMEKGKFFLFVTITGSPREKEREEITSLWKGSLSNANYDIQTFIMDQTLPSVCCVMGAMPRRSRTFSSVRAGVLMSLWRDRCHQQRRKRQREKAKQKNGKEKKEGDPKSQFSKEGNGAGNKQETCNRAAVASAWYSWDRAQSGLVGWGGRGKPHTGQNSSFL